MTKCPFCGNYHYGTEHICQDCQDNMAIHELKQEGIEILVLN